MGHATRSAFDPGFDGGADGGADDCPEDALGQPREEDLVEPREHACLFARCGEAGEEHLVHDLTRGGESEPHGCAVDDAVEEPVELIPSPLSAVDQEANNAHADRAKASHFLDDSSQQGLKIENGRANRLHKRNRDTGSQNEERRHGPQRLFLVHVDEANDDQVADDHQRGR